MNWLTNDLVNLQMFWSAPYTMFSGKWLERLSTTYVWLAFSLMLWKTKPRSDCTEQLYINGFICLMSESCGNTSHICSYISFFFSFEITKIASALPCIMLHSRQCETETNWCLLWTWLKFWSWRSTSAAFWILDKREVCEKCKAWENSFIWSCSESGLFPILPSSFHF